MVTQNLTIKKIITEKNTTSITITTILQYIHTYISTVTRELRHFLTLNIDSFHMRILIIKMLPYNMLFVTSIYCLIAMELVECSMVLKLYSYMMV